jgi:hypothetical protein
MGMFTHNKKIPIHFRRIVQVKIIGLAYQKIGCFQSFNGRFSLPVAQLMTSVFKGLHLEFRPIQAERGIAHGYY